MQLFRTASAAAMFVTALALCAAPAEARGGRAAADRDSPAAIRVLHDFAGCVAGDRWARARVRAILAMDYRTDAAREALRSFIATRRICVAPYSALRAHRLVFAGALAENLLPRDRALATLVAFDPARPPVQARDEREVMSLCVVRADPEAVGTLLATVPASAEEGAALRALSPLLGRCLRAGAQTRVNGLEVRALLALAAWRLAALNDGRPATSDMAGSARRPAT